MSRVSKLQEGIYPVWENYGREYVRTHGWLAILLLCDVKNPGYAYEFERLTFLKLKVEQVLNGLDIALPLALLKIESNFLYWPRG